MYVTKNILLAHKKDKNLKILLIESKQTQTFPNKTGRLLFALLK